MNYYVLVEVASRTYVRFQNKTSCRDDIKRDLEHIAELSYSMAIDSGFTAYPCIFNIMSALPTYKATCVGEEPAVTTFLVKLFTELGEPLVAARVFTYTMLDAESPEIDFPERLRTVVASFPDGFERVI